MSDLRDDERRVAERVIAEENAKRDHVVIYLSGAHAYGFPSPDSDLDLKAIHLESTARLVGLTPPALTFDRAEIVDGIEIDYTSNELASVLLGVLSGNGNFLERILGRLSLYQSGILDELRPLAQASLSRRLHHHYRGFAQNQRKGLEREPTAKKLLYVLRTALTGIHALRTSTIVTDLSELAEAHGVAGTSELIERKRAGERVALDGVVRDAWRDRLDALFVELDEARASSVLPEAPPNQDAIERWLIAVRRANLEATSRS
jgi:uncharacterized protein